MELCQFSFEAIGTAWVCDIYDEFSPEKKNIVLARMQQRIEAFDKVYSRFRADSLVTHISQKAGEYIFSQDAQALFELYKKLYDMSGGAFTPLIGNLLEDAGYDASYSLIPKKLQRPPHWEDVMRFDFPKLTVRKPVLLDFGAAGKGYLVDLIGDLFIEEGVAAYCIDAGGDILYRNQKKPLLVGLEHPNNPKQVIGVVTIANQSICGSAGNRRKWSNFHHIMNPRSLTSVDTYLASWVIADTALVADALTTALFFIEPEKLQKAFVFEYLLVLPDFSIKKSKHFPAELYYNKM